MPHLTLSLFGSPLVSLDGHAVTGFASKKALALLAYLAVDADRAHMREELAGLLWPDYAESSARANLRSVLANVRRVIRDHEASPPFLTITRQGVQFNRESDHHLDVDLSRVADQSRLIAEADRITHVAEGRVWIGVLAVFETGRPVRSAS